MEQNGYRKLEIQEKVKEFRPNENQLKFLEVYLSQEVRRSIEDMTTAIGINPATYYLWQRNPDFNEWFYKQIQANKYRYAPRILDNIFTKATSANATVQDKELALRVLEVYTPTSKTITETANYEEEIKKILNQARELIKVDND